MRSGQRLAAALLRAAVGCAAFAACDGDTVGGPSTATTGAAPALASANGAVGVTAGQAVSYDATKGGTAFTGPVTTTTTGGGRRGGGGGFVTLPPRR